MTFSGKWELDSAIMYSYLDSCQLYSGTESKKMRTNDNKSAARCLYGSTWKTFLRYNPDTGAKEFLPPDDINPNLGKTKIRCMEPFLEIVFKEFQQLYFADFEYDSVQITRNFEIKRHIDSKNIGESILVGFGEYTGGETVIEKEDGDEVVDIRNHLCKFNGSKYYHYVKPFTGGNRYSLVFFTQRKQKNILELLK